MALSGWIDRPKPKSKAVVWAAAGLIAVAVLIDLGIDRGDAPSWTATVLNTILFSARKLLHMEEAPRGPEAWSTPSPAEFKSFVDALSASPRAAEIGRTLIADPYVRDRWIAYQRDHDTMALFNSLQGYKPLQQTIATIASRPENAEVKALVAANPVGQALARRFPSAIGRGTLQAAAGTAAGSFAPAAGASRGVKGRGAYAVGSYDGASGNFGGGLDGGADGAVVDSEKLASGVGIAPGSTTSEAGGGYVSAPIVVPQAKGTGSIDAARCGAVDIACAGGKIPACDSLNHWTCVTPPNDCGTINVECTIGSHAICKNGQWACGTIDGAGACEPSGAPPQCHDSTFTGTATWDSAACRWVCANPSPQHNH